MSILQDVNCSETKPIFVMKNGIKKVPKKLYDLGMPKELISATTKKFSFNFAWHPPFKKTVFTPKLLFMDSKCYFLFILLFFFFSKKISSGTPVLRSPVQFLVILVFLRKFPQEHQ